MYQNLEFGRIKEFARIKEFVTMKECGRKKGSGTSFVYFLIEKYKQKNSETTTMKLLLFLSVLFACKLSRKEAEAVYKLTSLFEFGRAEILYDQCLNNFDGRGYTAGRAGFTTGTADAFMVIDYYMKKRLTNNPFRSMYQILKRRAENFDGSVSGLDNFCNAWKQASTDSKFIRSQNKIMKILYYKPSQVYSRQLGLEYTHSRGFVYDTFIQHGDGNDFDSARALFGRCSQAAGGTPSSGVDEIVWMYHCLVERKRVLMNASDSSTRDVWRESATRVDAFYYIYSNSNFALASPIRIDVEDYDELISTRITAAKTSKMC